MADTQKRIELRKSLAKWRDEVLMPLVKEFDGKVYNKRLITRANELVPNNLWHVRESSYSRDIEVQARLNEWNYSDYESVQIPMRLTQPSKENGWKGGRVDYKAIEQDRYTKSWAKSHDDYTKEMETSISNYDDYMKVYQHLVDAVNEWNELPHTFRAHTRASDMHIY